MPDQTKDLDLDSALRIIKENKTRMVWLGREPLDYICELLQVDKGVFIYADPNEMLEMKRNVAMKFKKHVFVCYHGVTSDYVARLLKNKYGVDAYSLRGGVAGIVGEIF
jgi:rhodanese-related sulfurtransferase